MHNLLNIMLIQFSIFIRIKLFELLSQKLLVFFKGAVQKACNKLGVVNGAAVIKVHCLEDLLNICISEIAVDFFL